MNWNNIRLIYIKEISGAIRDRRTLISMIIIPLIFYPLLFLGIGYFTMMGQEKSESLPSVVTVRGEEYAPELMETLKKNEKIDLVYFEENQDKALEAGEIYLLLDIPEHFNLNTSQESTKNIVVRYDSTVQYSQVARRRVTNLIENYRQQIIQKRIEQLGLNANYVQPISTQWLDISSEERKTGSILGMILPYIIVILIFIGAMHSAVDITAGEKERGTLATLLVSQLSRFEIVMGKYFTVMTISATSMILGLIGLSIAFLAPAYALGEISLIKINFPFSMFFLFFLVLAPLVGLASAILLLIGIFARNNKEASTYVTPIYMGAIFLGMISLSQGIELAEPMFFIPILNNSFTFKELLMGIVNWEHILSTLVSNIAIALVALLVAAYLFTRENVLFRS
ncbi:MAG TPA: ABC transporter permease [Atribacterota bacterium]|nr:ABC transporter permease [Atribacterota bacterium]